MESTEPKEVGEFKYPVDLAPRGETTDDYLGGDG